MATGALINNGGKLIILDRSYNTAPTRTPPSVYALGINNGTPLVTDTDLDKVIPISVGTVNDDCNSAFTGSSGGTNSTNNTTTYKVGGGVTDYTAQNLIANSSSATKTWRKTVDSNFTAARYSGFWLYVKDSTALAKFLTAGTALQARWETDTSNYYAKTWTAAELEVGWNWLDSVSLINVLTATGSPGTLSAFAIIITTNNSTDTFVAGDVIIDLVRTWQSSDLYKAITSVAIDETTLEATVRGDITTTEAVGYAPDGVALKNDAGTMFSESTMSEKGKGESDEFVLISKHQHA